MNENIVLIVVDSLRACSLVHGQHGKPLTPFLDSLSARTTWFRRAYATECWTLPTHLSMFTGLLPSEHGAHFQTMAYGHSRNTLAETLHAAGYHTEVITRNSLFDGTVPGATRGFAVNTRILGTLRSGITPLAIVLALAKPRLRRVMARSGFFHMAQREQRDFLLTLVRLGIPADELVLNHALDRMVDLNRRRRRYLLFLNLYDVHAPYSPSLRSPLRSFRSRGGWIENAALPWVLPRISSHAYLRPGFRLSNWSRRMLLGRYHRAIELMDGKLERFYATALEAGLLDNTVLILTSDHGEAFGEHDLYFHDASVYDVHLRVPLWIHHPGRVPEVVDGTVSTAGLCALLTAVALGGSLEGTMLDGEARAGLPIALAEHFHYPHSQGLVPKYVQNIAAAIVGTKKARIEREGVELYDLRADPGETAAVRGTIADFEDACRSDGVPRRAIDEAVAHLRRWESTGCAA